MATKKQVAEPMIRTLHEGIDTLQMSLEEANDIIFSLHMTIEEISPGWHEREEEKIKNAPSIHRRVNQALLLRRVGEETE